MLIKKSLRELGKEYESAAEQLKKVIAQKRNEMKNISDAVCSNRMYELKRELKVLYGEYRDAKEIADYLKTYYEPHNGCKELFNYR